MTGFCITMLYDKIFRNYFMHVLYSMCVCLSVCAHQCSVSDVVLRVEGSSAGDGGFVQRVTVWLTVVIVDREVLHVHRPLRPVRLDEGVKHPNKSHPRIWQNAVNTRPLQTLKWNLCLSNFTGRTRSLLGLGSSTPVPHCDTLGIKESTKHHMTDISKKKKAAGLTRWCATKPELLGVWDICLEHKQHGARCLHKWRRRIRRTGW